MLWVSPDLLRLLSIDVPQSLLETKLEELIIDSCNKFGYIDDVLYTLVQLRGSSTLVDTENITLFLITTARQEVYMLLHDLFSLWSRVFPR